MSKYIYKFDTYAAYLAAKDSLEIPSISYVKDMEVVISNGIDEVSSDMPEKVATPVVTFNRNKFTVTCETTGVTIYYTIGTSVPADPTIDSSVYSSPIAIQESMHIKVIAVKYGMIKSDKVQAYGQYVAPVGNILQYSSPNDESERFMNERVLGENIFRPFDASIVNKIYDSTTQIGQIIFDSDLTEISTIHSENGDSMTSGNYSFTEFIIPSTVKRIGNNQSSVGAFMQAPLTNIALPSSIEYIGSKTILWCNALTSLNIPDSIKKLDGQAISNNSSLTTIIIGSGIEEIGRYALADNEALTTITVKAVVPPTMSNENPLNGNTSLAHIYVPAASVDAYKVASGWSTYASIIEAIPA